jgi:DNA repair photolyase
VHFTVTPFPPEVLRAIEPYSPRTERRWKVVQQLKEAGLRVHVNVSPIIPLLSEGFEEEFVNKLIELQVDEYFVDPMQPYKESWEALKASAAGLKGVDFPKIEQIMLDRDEYLDWKFDYLQRWNEHREPLQHKAPDQLPIWSDHEHGVWVNMLNGEQMSKRAYGDEYPKFTP